MTEPILRPATSVDAPEVARIWHAGWRDGHLGSVPDALLPERDEASFIERAPLRVADTTVLEVDGHVAGFIMILGDEADQVYLDAKHRGSGLASMLLAEAERQIAAAGHDTAWLAVVAGNARARKFYERSGWSDAGLFAYQAETRDGTTDVPCHRYEKALTL